MMNATYYKPGWFYKPGRFYSIVKRFLDISIAAVGLVVLSPLFFIISLAIKRDSPGAVFFTQKRVGQYGIFFRIFKFRTMVENAEDILHQNLELLKKYKENYKLTEMDPRLTNVGRFLRKSSLDELPQLLNVLKGEMSLVGPRPLVPDELNQYYSGLEDRFLSVKPGITGYWQVKGRSSINYPERIDVEMYYVNHQSLKLDIKILLLTLLSVLTKKGAM